MILKNLPNLMTVVNLFCGCIAVVALFSGQVWYVAVLVAVAAIMDFLDGFVARMVNNVSDFGKQLDSLADMVTFGVVPGAALFQMMTVSNHFEWFEKLWVYNAFCYAMFAVTIFSCLRLAKFNIDTRQSSSFIGLPTPANTILILSLYIIGMKGIAGLDIYLLNPLILLGIASLSSWLLVAELPLFSFKFKNFGWKDNKAQFLLVASAIVLLPVFKIIALPVIILLYITLSILFPPPQQK